MDRVELRGSNVSLLFFAVFQGGKQGGEEADPERPSELSREVQRERPVHL